MNKIVPQDVIDAVSDSDKSLPIYTQGLIQARTPDAARKAAAFAIDGLEKDLALYRDGALTLPGSRTPKRTPERVEEAVRLLRAFLGQPAA